MVVVNRRFIIVHRCFTYLKIYVVVKQLACLLPNPVHVPNYQLRTPRNSPGNSTFIYKHLLFKYSQTWWVCNYLLHKEIHWIKKPLSGHTGTNEIPSETEYERGDHWWRPSQTSISSHFVTTYAFYNSGTRPLDADVLTDSILVEFNFSHRLTVVKRIFIIVHKYI